MPVDERNNRSASIQGTTAMAQALKEQDKNLGADRLYLSAPKAAGRRMVPHQLLTQSELPLWHDNMRGLPNPMARSALFTVGNQNKPRQFYRTHQVIQSIGGYTITYRGEELRQEDLTVFMQLVHMARSQPLSEHIEFSAYSFLKAVNWTLSRDGYQRLREALDRLQGTSLRITSQHVGEGGFQGALIRKFSWRDDFDLPLAKWVVYLEPEIVSLFGGNAYTQIVWQLRLRLRSALACFLHSYYSSHAEPFAVRVETLHVISGSRTARLTDFRKSLKAALNELQEKQFLSWSSIDHNDLVHVKRTRQALTSSPA